MAEKHTGRQNRRDHLKSLGALVGGASLISGTSRANDAAPSLPAGADTSRLIYITPLKKDASESTCQAEVWFMRDGDDLYVVTATEAWRAQAIGRGLDVAKIWVGDVGVWSRNPEYRDLPFVLTRASIVSDPALRASLLEKFGSKYSDEWPVWGPRWKDGLADGSRLLIRYRLV
ncbi:MAG: hypothetical protein EP301_04440 [Gammaproteobacteria bacterium]|nr:MAG: hypothetical protein EP301_04440 [Gammaproteobacteria bacterium]